MHYALVTETYPPEVNGVALTVQSLEHGLRERGHAVSLVRPRQDGDDAEACGSDILVRGVALPRYPGLRAGLPATRQLLDTWSQARPEAIYIATEGPLGWSALRAARRLGIPAATGFHTRFDEYMRDYRLGWLEPVALRWMRHFHNRADVTVVPTHELQRFLWEAGFRCVRRLSRGVDTELFHPDRRDPATRARLGVAGGAPLLIHVGRLAPEKNLALAMRAYRRLLALRPDARLVCVGDGPMGAALRRDNPDVVFTGILRGEALARVFASADLFVFPSLSETFGNVTLEAMASGIATVAYAYGAAGEHLRDGVHGAAIDPGDEAALLAAVVRIGGDARAMRAMGRAARAAVQGLSTQRVAEDFDRLLAGLARGVPSDANRTAA